MSQTRYGFISVRVESTNLFDSINKTFTLFSSFCCTGVFSDSETLLDTVRALGVTDRDPVTLGDPKSLAWEDWMLSSSSLKGYRTKVTLVNAITLNLSMFIFYSQFEHWNMLQNNKKKKIISEAFHYTFLSIFYDCLKFCVSLSQSWASSKEEFIHSDEPRT